MDKNLGAVNTPDVLADWVAAELVSRLPRDRPLLVIDPACGDGVLLRSVQKATGRREIRLAGVDIDRNAIRKAALTVARGTTLKCADALQPKGNVSGVESSWKTLLDTGSIAGVISNPPWGAQLRQTPLELREAGYQLAKGQFDSYDLFVELCLKIVPDHAILAFILPDSIFLPEHRALRTLLLERTQLRLIARLGEGFFADVFRGTAVLVCEKAKPCLARHVECFRLRKEQRGNVLAGRISLQTARARDAHLIAQERFHADSEKRFMIDVTREDFSFFERINAYRSEWTNLLTSGRGVELSKSGAIVLCPDCGAARPEPRERTSLTCRHCGTAFDTYGAKRKCIVKQGITVPQGWKRLIVGEDVNRYWCQSSRVIEADVLGINYKEPATFEGTKLLIRKTGVGLKAAIDNSGALTNQVVFHYKSKPGRTPAFFLDYVLGVLCSRTMLAYHLKRTGDNEWRSHPYVTQKTIAELPVPVPSEGHWQWRQANAIGAAVSRRRSDLSTDVAGDLYIDSLVAGLYGLDEKGCARVLNVLTQAQSLQAITTMRAEPGQVRPLRI